MKLALIILLGLCFIYLGYCVKKYYKNRYDFYYNFTNFIQILLSEISFLKSDISKVAQSNSFGSILDNWLNSYVNGNISNISFLTDEENTQLISFISGIGKSDMQGELANINYHKSLFESKLQETKGDIDIKAGMYFKLISLAGVILCIIFI